MDYYKSLIPCILDLRKAVFPGGKLRRKGDKGLYSQILQTTNSSQKDNGVIFKDIINQGFWGGYNAYSDPPGININLVSMCSCIGHKTKVERKRACH